MYTYVYYVAPNTNLPYSPTNVCVLFYLPCPDFILKSPSKTGVNQEKTFKTISCFVSFYCMSKY